MDRTSIRAGAADERLRSGMILGAAFFLIVAFAAVLRFWNLGVRTFHSDESIYSLLSAQLARGAVYEHLPSAHGPFHFFGTALIFRIFGEGDVSARMLPALAGVALVAMPFAFRRYIGFTGAIVAALLLCVSPTMLYYSRFAGPEMYVALFGAIVAMLTWRYLAKPERPILYAIAAALAFMFVSSEMALVVAPIFAAYLAYLVAADLLRQMSDAADEQTTGGVSHYELLGVDSDASAKEIRLAYQHLVEQEGSRSGREALAHAYGVLTNANRRAAYDRKLARRATHSTAPAVRPGIATKTALLAAAPFIALAWPFIAGIRRRMRVESLPVAADPLLVISLLALPFYGPLVQKLWFVGDRGFDGQSMIYVIGGEDYVPGGELPIMLATLGVLASIALVAGWAWRWHAWVVCWAIFNGIAITMFTGFFSNQGGIWTGYWGTLDYWFRPDTALSARPPFYYGMLLAVYEFLPLAIIAIGAAYAIARGAMRARIAIALAAVAFAAIVAMPSWAPIAHEHRASITVVVALGAVLAVRMPPLTKFLAFWTVGAFFGFSAVEQKEPWVAVNIAVPMALLSAKLVNDAVAAVPVPQIAMPSLRLNFGARLVQGSIAASVAGVAVFTLYAALLASWGHGNVPQLQHKLALRDDGDTPIELLQPAQTAPDVREIRDAIVRAGAETGEGTSIPVAVDTSYDFASTWLWYLRDYENLELIDMRRGYEAPSGSIVLADARNRGRLTGTQAALSITYTQQWAFPHRFDVSTRELAADFVSTGRWSEWLRYATDRASVGELRTSEGVAYFPREVVAVLPVVFDSDVLGSNVEPDAEE